MSIRKARENGYLKLVIESLEKSSKLIPYIDDEVEIIIIEESTKPILVLNREYYEYMEKKIIGEQEKRMS